MGRLAHHARAALAGFSTSTGSRRFRSAAACARAPSDFSAQMKKKMIACVASDPVSAAAMAWGASRRVPHLSPCGPRAACRVNCVVSRRGARPGVRRVVRVDRPCAFPRHGRVLRARGPARFCVSSMASYERPSALSWRTRGGGQLRASRSNLALRPPLRAKAGARLGMKTPPQARPMPSN